MVPKILAFSPTGCDNPHFPPGERPMADKPATKTEILKTLVEKTSVAKKDVTSVLENLMELIKHDLGKKGPGIFTIPGMVKFKVVNKPATKERMGINPQTKEPMLI